MSSLKILHFPHPFLRSTCQEIEKSGEETLRLGRKLCHYLKIHPDAAAIAAPQVGEPIRLICLKDFSKKEPNQHAFCLLNPKILTHSAKVETDYEGCLSLPNLFGRVTRFERIKIAALTLEGEEIVLKVQGFLSRVIQHEIDHLDGKLLFDRSYGPLLTNAELKKEALGD